MTAIRHQRITLIQPPLRLNRDFIDYPYHSDLAVVQAATLLLRCGFDVSVVNAFSMPESGLVALEDDWVLMGGPIEAVDTLVGASELFIIHYTPFHRPPVREPVLMELLDRIRAKNPQTPIVLADLYQSGEHYVEAPASSIRQAYPQADVVLKYQAEVVLEDVCRRLLAEGRPQEPIFIDGPEMADLDALPVPDWSLINLDHRDLFMARMIEHLGRGAWAFPVGGRTLPLITSRGCPYRCGHCSSNPGRQSGDPKSQVRPSKERVRRMVHELVVAHGASRVMILDEMVNVDEGHFSVLVDALDSHGVHYDFPNGMRADRVKSHHLKTMAGKITTLSVSAESGVQHIVDDVVDKKLNLNTIEETIHGATELGIRTLVHFIIGMPGETRENVEETLNYALSLYTRFGAWPAVQFATPLPGTRLADDVELMNGDALPIIEDYGPLFQHHPVTIGQDFGSTDLKYLKWVFEQKLEQSERGRTISFQPTYRSNDAFGSTGDKSRVPSDESYELQCQQLAEERGQGATGVEFSGGEPTLCEHLLALIRHCRSIGYERIAVVTNGRMAFYDKYARALMSSGATELRFLIHGADTSSHGEIVGVEEAFEQTIGAIGNCMAQNHSAVQLSLDVALSAENHRQLAGIVELAWSLNLRNLYVSFPGAEMASRDHPGMSVLKAVLDTWCQRMNFRIFNAAYTALPGYESLLRTQQISPNGDVFSSAHNQVDLVN